MLNVIHRVTTKGKKKKKNNTKKRNQKRSKQYTRGKKSQNKSVIDELNKICKCSIEKQQNYGSMSFLVNNYFKYKKIKQSV